MSSKPRGFRFRAFVLAVAAGAAAAKAREASPLRPPGEGTFELRDLRQDTWSAKDALGRELPGYDECGPRRPGKFVGIFYFLWLGAHGAEGPFDLTRIHASADDDIEYGPPGAFHFWGQPELGYYVSDDRYVLRRHASMLADAGIDVIAIDVSNAVLYEDQFEALCETWLKMRSEGNQTPQVMFLAHTREQETVARLYEKYYAPGRFRDLWFYWEGRPLILASPDGHAADVASFFTFRKTWAWSSAAWFGDGEGKWTWLDHTPQQPGWTVPGRPEQISVSVAEHATTNMGRSFHGGRQPPPEERDPNLGLHFAEQWERALEVDPEFVFVTGWNEWVAQRFVSDGKRWTSLAGVRLSQGDSVFVDAYSQEYSRDIEPMAGGHGDNYYYQMVAGIRRYKGVSGPPILLPRSSIEIDGDFQDWEQVPVRFLDTIGDVDWRQHPAWGGAPAPPDKEGRNDFATLKVAGSASAICFYAKAALPFRMPEGGPGIVLLVSGRSQQGGVGQDFTARICINRKGAAVAARLVWDDPSSRSVSHQDVGVALSGDQLEVEFPLTALPEGWDRIQFKWIDNPADMAGASPTRSGDVAPNGRFHYQVLEDGGAGAGD